MTTPDDDDVCGCCDRAPCVHEDEPSIEEIEAEDAHRVAQLDADWKRTWAAWPAANRTTKDERR